MDIVFIRQLKVATVIGAYQWERSLRQTLVLDLEMAADNRKAARNDRLEDALDYAAISSGVKSLVENSSYTLIESLAEAVTDLLLSEYSLRWVRLRVAKPGAVMDAEEVGVVIERGARAD